MGEPTPDRTWRQVGLFVALTALFTLPFWWMMIAHRRLPAATEILYGLMWGPGVAALIVKRPAELGWRWPARRDLAFGWLVPVGYCVVVYGVVCGFRLAQLAEPALVEKVRIHFNLGELGDAPTVAFGALWALTIGTLANAAPALGEEIGWRGFLAPVLTRRYGVLAAGVISGFTWAAWHYPLLFLRWGWTWWALVCFTLMVTAMGVILAWLRARSASLWPAVLFHASHNSFLTYCDRITGDTGWNRQLLSETGAGVAVTCTAIAAYLLVRDRARQTSSAPP